MKKELRILACLVLLASAWFWVVSTFFPGPRAAEAMPFIILGLAIGVTGVVSWILEAERESKRDSV
jgi:hypothetical protein